MTIIAGFEDPLYRLGNMICMVGLFIFLWLIIFYKNGTAFSR